MEIDEIKKLISEQALENEVPEDIALAVAEKESSFDQTAIGTSGEIGLFQLLPGAAQDTGIEDRADINQNIQGGIKYLKQMYTATKSWEDALVAYNGGIGNFQKGTPSKAAQEYSKDVFARASKYRKPADEDSTQESDEEEDDTARAQAPRLEEPKPLNYNVPTTKAGFATVLEERTNRPDFYGLSFIEQTKEISDIYKAKQWGKEAYPLYKDVMNNLWDSADPDDLPDIEKEVGAPPISQKDPKAETEAWKVQVVQDLLDKGISPGAYGNRLDAYMDKAAQDEVDAFSIRNRSGASIAASTVGNWVRDVAKGGVGGVLNAVGGGARLIGFPETADVVESYPDLLGKPNNAYLYETDTNGYLVKDPQGNPIPRWQSEVSQTVGNIGTFLMGGFAAKALGYSNKAVGLGFFGVNTLSSANNIFKDVYEKTGDINKAYTGSLYAIPAAALGSLGELAVVSKFANPVLKALTPYNKAKYLGNVFARNALVGATSNAAFNATEQLGKISQTGEEFNVNELALNTAIGGGVSGTVSAVMGRKPLVSSQSSKLPPVTEAQTKGSVAEQQTAAANLEKFQIAPQSELVVPNDEAAKVRPEVLDTLGLTATPGEAGTVIAKKTSYVPLPVSEDLTTLNKDIEELHYSLVKDKDANSAFTLSEKLTNLKKEYADSTALLDDASIEGVRQRTSLEIQLKNARANLNKQTDPTLREVAHIELQEAKATLDKFDIDNEYVFNELPAKVGEIDSQIQDTQARLENVRRGTFVNDVSLKQRNLAEMLIKRKELVAKLMEEQKLQAEKASKTEGEKPKPVKVQTTEEIIADATPELDETHGVPVAGKYVTPINGKWYVANKNGEIQGAGRDYYSNAVDEASGISRPALKSEKQEGKVPPLPEEESVLPPGSSVGAKKAENLFAMKTGERIMEDPNIAPLVKQKLEQEGVTIYEKQSHAQSDRLGQEFINGFPSVEEATQAFINLPPDTGRAEYVFAGNKLKEYYNKQTIDALKNGDTAGAERAATQTMKIAERLMSMTNTGGQIVDAAKVAISLDPDVIILNARKTAKDHNLPGLSKEQEFRIRELMDSAKKTGGVIQQNLLTEVMSIENVATKGAFNEGSSPLYTYWIANQLSDPSTQAVNLIGNMAQVTGSLASFLSTGLPRGNFDGVSMLKGYVKGALKEGFDAAMLELKGIQTYKPQAGKADTSTAPSIGRADFVKNAPAWMKKIGLNNIGYVLRALSASDIFFYKTAQEGMANLAAHNVSTKEGLTGNARKNRMAELLYNSTDEWNKANTQAKAEVAEASKVGLKPSKQLENTRTWEILEAKRPESIRNESQRFAAKSTFTNKPEGILGNLVQSINKFAGTPVEMPGGKIIRPFKYLFPFMNTAANIANASLDYTLVGGFRAGFDSKISNIERRNAAGKFMLGSLLSGTVIGIAREYMDDKDPYFALYAAGPKDPQQRKQWIESGAKPYSIKIGDDYFRYSETPVGIALGSIAAVFDAYRYDKNFNSADLPEAAAIALSGSLKSFSDNSFLKSIGTVVKAVTGETKGKPSEVAAEVFLINPIKGFNPAAGAQRAISKLIQDPIDTKNSFYAKLVSQVPWAQGFGTKPSLGMFGEPVERTWEDRLSAFGRFYSERVEDPAINWLASTGYMVPDFGITVSGSKALKNKRGETLGAIYAEVLTPEERYQLIEQAGPLIKERVLQYRKAYGDRPFSEVIQKNLTEDIKKIRSKVRRKIAIPDED